jgi:hypothetical protein
MIGKVTTEFYESDFSHVCLPSLFEVSINRVYPSGKYFGESTKGIDIFHASECGWL